MEKKYVTPCTKAIAVNIESNLCDLSFDDTPADPGNALSKHNTFDFEDNDSIDNTANVAWEESILLAFARLRLVRCRRLQPKKKQSVIRKVGK